MACNRADMSMAVLAWNVIAVGDMEPPMQHSLTQDSSGRPASAKELHWTCALANGNP